MEEPAENRGLRYLRNSSMAGQVLLEHGWVKSFDWRYEIDSTNTWARRWLASQPSATQMPALFVADKQTAGRGRAEHQWWSPEGCLMLTVAIAKEHLLEEAGQASLVSPQLALVCGVAVAETVASQFPSTNQSDHPVQLKWPNDLFLDGKKCGGILMESVGQTHFLIGIGLNIRVNFSQAPPGIAARAISLHEVLPPSSDTAFETELKWPMLLNLVDELQAAIQTWRSDQNAWHESWQRFCLLSGKRVQVRHSLESLIEGRCTGVDGQGHLVIIDEGGKRHRLHSGEIIRWRDSERPKP